MPAGLLDSNVWLAAAFAEHPAHAVARGMLRKASAVEPALWCRATQQSLLRRYLSALLSARDAWIEHLNAVYCALLFMGHA